jgi:hypothetical protein
MFAFESVGPIDRVEGEKKQALHDMIAGCMILRRSGF